MDTNLANAKPLAAFFAPTVEIAQRARTMAQELELNLEVYDYFSEAMIPALKNHDYQLVIAAGACANILRKNFDFTVLELLSDLSSFFTDIDALMTAGASKIAVMGSPGNIASFQKVDFAHSQLTFYPVHDMGQVPVYAGEILLNGINGVLSGQMVNEYLLKHYPHLKTRVFSCSDSSLTNTLLAAKRILHLEKVKRLQLTRLDLLINNIQEGVIIFNKKQETVFYNVLAEKILHDYHMQDWYDTVSPLFEQTLDKHAVVHLGNKQVLMHTMHFVFPNTDIDNHLVLLQEASAIEAYEHTIRRHNINKGLIAKATFSSMILKEQNMEQLVEKAKLFARTDSTVLIYGETGTGKEVLAQSIHNHSHRKSEPFVSLNCASLPPSLIESELFGYAEGAFTGARKQGKKGLFELADKGTIFLDEIGELTLDVQSRLLRVLQEREVMRVGDDKIIPLDVRVICATNRDLLKMASQGTFRLDLYYRINVLQLRIPALRERPKDIYELFTTYTKSFLGKAQSQNLTIDDDALCFLQSYPWPGNIRQLRNVSEAIVLYGPHITLAKLCEIMCLTLDQAYAFISSLSSAPTTATANATASASSSASARPYPLSSATPSYGSNSPENNAIDNYEGSSHEAIINEELIKSAMLANHHPYLAPTSPHTGAGAATGTAVDAGAGTGAIAGTGIDSSLGESTINAHEGSTDESTKSNNLKLVLELPPDFKLKDLERVALQSLLKTTSQQDLCSRLNISRVTLWRKLKEPTSN